MRVTASAAITQGVKTNRVRVRRRPPQDPSPQRAVRRYKSAGSLGPGPGTVVAVSLSAADLAAMDDLAEHMGMSRSHLIREAVKAYRERVGK